MEISNEALVGTANFLAGGLASLSSQFVFVPIDVVLFVFVEYFIFKLI